MERAGVAAFHIEDQSFPKRCGHLDDKSLIDAGEMCRKIRIARQTLSDDDALVIARTDASLWKVSMPPSRAPNAISRPAPT